MDWEKIERKVWNAWTIVAILSFVLLSMPMLEVHHVGVSYQPEDIYSGYRLLIATHIKGYPAFYTILGRIDIEFVLLKVVIALQLFFDIMLIFVWISEKLHFKLKKFYYAITRRVGIVIYPLLLLANQRCIQFCLANREADFFGSRIYRASRYNNEWNFKVIFFSLVIVLSLFSIFVIIKRKIHKKSR